MKIFYLSLFVYLLNFCETALSQGYKTSCSNSKFFTLEIKSHVNLNNDLIPKNENFDETSVLQQINFFKSHLKYKLKKLKTEIVFQDNSIKLYIQNRRTLKGLSNLNVKQIVHPSVQVTNGYIVNALDKKLSETSSFSKIEYTAKINAMVCLKKNKNFLSVIKSPKLQAPADPWMAHWLQSESKHFHVKWNVSEFKIPAYFDSEYADIPHPEYSWYFWNPEYEGIDINKKTYRAKDELSRLEGIVTSTVNVTNLTDIEEKKDLSNFIFNDKNMELKATFIFGVTDPNFKRWDFNNFFQDKTSGGFSNWKIIHDEILKVNRAPDMDRGAVYATGFLGLLNKFLDMNDFHFSYLKKEGYLEIKSRLKHSKVKTRIRFLFGFTDLMAPDTPVHWELARLALMEDDLISYVGHSGLGENFKIQNIISNSSLKNKSIDKKKRIISIFTCYSANYFEKDLSEILDNKSLLILTGSSYTSARGPLGLMEWLDNTFEKKSKAFLPYVEEGDFLIFKTFSDAKL